MFYYLYQITNKINGKKYVGVHKTKDLDDEYMGSGKILRHAIEKYGIENFEKSILEMFTTSEDMFSREKEIVNEEFLSRDDVYNIRRGGSGGFDYINKNRLNGAIVHSRKGNKNSFYGKTHTEETKAIIREHRLNQIMPLRTIEHNEKIRQSLIGKKHTEERKRKVSEANKGKVAYNKGIPAPIFYCTYCNRNIAGASNFSRWHGNNCKLKE